MRVLYLSCHAILEYDELRIFEELGIDYFSLGSYIDPQHPVDPIRPALKKSVERDFLSIAPMRDKLPIEFVRHFTHVIIMHIPEWITANWDVFKQAGVHVSWRTIGQSKSSIEQSLFSYRLNGLDVIRYSKREANIKDSCGCTKIIPFYKDEDEFCGYNGSSHEVITFSQDMKHRGEFCNYDAWMKVSDGLPMRVFGPKNEEMGEKSGGFLSYEQMKQKMRDARVYFYTGTQPASYTLNFIEAMMTGIPIVALGPKHANSLDICGDVYEIPDIITNGSTGFWSDDIDELRMYIRKLLDTPSLAKAIGDSGRKRAIELFGKNVVKNKWKEYFDL